MLTMMAHPAFFPAAVNAKIVLRLYPMPKQAQARGWAQNDEELGQQGHRQAGHREWNIGDCRALQGDHRHNGDLEAFVVQGAHTAERALPLPTQSLQPHSTPMGAMASQGAVGRELWPPSGQSYCGSMT